MNARGAKAAVILAALGAGLAAGFAHPPFGFWPGLAGYALLMWLVDRTDDERSGWKAFGLGWLAGFGYFFVGCWWVAEAFLVDARQAWMAPFAAALLPAGMGLFWGAACALYRKIARPDLTRVIAFAGVFALFEWIRGHVLTGFPWNLAGETWTAGSPPSQVAAWIGAYGLTFLTVLAVVCFEPLFHPGPMRRRAGVALTGVAILAGLWIAGSVRLAGAGRAGNTHEIVRVVQADVPQEAKWSPEQQRNIIQRYLNLTARPGKRTPDYVVWPEGALPGSLDEFFAPGAEVREGVKRALQPGQTLLLGGYRGEPTPDGGAKWYNSLVALRDTGDDLQVTGVYDKHRLVPFGEFLPLEPLAEKIGLKEMVHVGDGFSPGPRPAPIRLNGTTVQPLICYESLFPGLPTQKRGRASWIVNVSNDAWFGKTSGPKQHLNLASYRAIEQGLPIIRATPTGVSAVISPYGRVLEGARLDSGESGVIDAPLPAALEPTLYSRFGDLAFWVLTLSALIFAFWSRFNGLKLSDRTPI
ncbi:apolipoprotein N-acyltransferase [Caulobacter sp. 17J65-9]|uniref:apolipoprotein N-acyltransferase n=1 Tax=Caulobacter sp. 17J65-9 TaxID=2709382 RepID=UPI00320495FC